jgi:hypothetical protein
METTQAVSNSSDPVGSNPATSTTTVTAAGATPTSAPVVAPKGLRLELQQMLQGWQSVIPGDSTMQSSAGSLTQAAVVGKLQGWLGLYTALDTEATAYKQARVPVTSMQPEARQYLAVLKAALANSLGPQSPQLAQFGLKPKKVPRPLTAAQLAVRVAKARATRQLRGTKGPVEKAKTKAGPMQFVEPVASATATVGSTSAAPATVGSTSSAPATVGSTSSAPAASAASLPAEGK